MDYTPRKEPWEMTSDEYKRRGMGEATAGTIRRCAEARKQIAQVELQMLACTGFWKRNRVQDLATRKTIIGALHEFEPHTVETALRSPKVPKELKERHRTLMAFSGRLSEQASFEASHRCCVEKALAEGKDIPAEVLEEYSDLKDGVLGDALQYALCAFSYFRSRWARTPRFKRAKSPHNRKQTVLQRDRQVALARKYIRLARAAGFRGSVTSQAMEFFSKEEQTNVVKVA